MVRRSFSRALVFGFVVSLALAGAAVAHEQRGVGAVTLRVGWQNEPTFTGSVNAVLVEVEKGGTPVTDAKLTAVVLFGDKTSTTKSGELTLEGSDEEQGTYTAALVPTRPGTYTFHITGDAGGMKVDQFFTSGEKTFDEVKDPTADQFPVKDPTSGQLAQRIANVDARAAKASNDAKRAMIALVIALAALVLAIVALGRRR